MSRAYSPAASPPLSNTRGRAGTRSPSPISTQPQSKREKRRTMLAEKLTEMVASFSANHVEHFYAQLSAMQCDINLVLRADPYRDGPLDDAKDDIDRLVAAAREEICRNRPIAPEAESSFQALGGQFYAKFVQDVNAAMEERDTELTQAYQRHTDTIAALHRSASYKRQLAHEEHALLSSALRERLIQQVTAKRAKLLRDKEQLDIADSNALLLNPTQFSIGNPASPGGALSNRKTRHTRGRADAPEDAENKRKRKAPFDEEAAGSASPLPQASKEAPAASAQPAKDSKSRLIASQFEAPLYSVDRLFSEKELALNLNRAYLQTNQYFEKLRAQGLENRLNTTTSASLAASAADVGGDVNMDEADAADDEENANTAANNTSASASASANSNAKDSTNSKDKEREKEGQKEKDPASPGLSPTKERDQPAHATRSTRPAPDLAFGMRSGYPPPPYGIGIHISTSASKTNATVPQLAGLPDTEATNDLEMMRLGTSFAGYEQLVERGTDKGWSGGLNGLEGVSDMPSSRRSGLDVLGDLASAPEQTDKGKGRSAALESVGMARVNSALSEAGRRGRR